MAQKVSNNTRIFNSAEDAQRFYEDVKFDCQSEGYKKINKQITDPVPKCGFCSKSCDKHQIMGIKVNDNEKKTQVVASICEDHNKMLRELDKMNPELAEVQNMVRFFFPESADSIIKLFYMNQKWKECGQTIYLEYYAALKWSVEELMLMKITDAKPINETPSYTRCSANDKCVLCGESNITTFDFFSPIKQCWLCLEVCEKCHSQLSLDAKDMEFELREIYFGSYEKIDGLLKRVALQEIADQIKKFQHKVIFLDIRMNAERVCELLNIIGVDEEHSLLQPKAEEKAEEKTEDTPEEKAEETGD